MFRSIFLASIFYYCSPGSFGVVDAAVSCDILQQPTLNLGNGVTLQQIANYDAGTFTMQLTYTGGRSWIGMGINEDGRTKMTPANAVIGRAFSIFDGSSTSVLKYSLTSDAEDGSGVNAFSSQNLQDASFVQTDSTSTLTFTQLLNEPEQVVSDSSTWIYAVGLADNQWTGKHKIHGSFQLTLTACDSVPATPSPTISPTSSPTRAPVVLEPTGSPRPTASPGPTAAPTISPAPTESPAATDGTLGGTSASNSGSNFVLLDTTHPNRSLWAAHGILLAIAWGICAPIGIGAAMLRNGLVKLYPANKGLWYQIHMYMNMLTVVLTCLGFFIAVIATKMEYGRDFDGRHFDGTHHKAGLTIFLLVMVQAFAGYFRPDLPKATPPQKKVDTTVNTGVVDIEVELDHTDTSRPSPSLPSSSQSDISTAESSNDVVKMPQKSPQRLAWDYGHRLLGMTLLGLAWYNCHSGIELQVQNWEDQKDLTGAFWGVTAGISGMVFILSYIIRV